MSDVHAVLLAEARGRLSMGVDETVDAQASLLRDVLRSAKAAGIVRDDGGDVRDMPSIPSIGHRPSSGGDVVWRTSGYTGPSKEFHYSDVDVGRIVRTWALYGVAIGITPDHRYWNFGGAPPMVSGDVLERAGRLIGLRGISTLLSKDTDLMRGIKRVSRAGRVDLFTGPTIVYYILSRLIEDESFAKDSVRKAVADRYRLPDGLAAIVARLYLMGLDNDGLRDMARNVTIGISYAEPLTPYKDIISREMPRIGMHDVFGSTECPIIAATMSPSDDGLSMMLHDVIPEIAEPGAVLETKSSVGGLDARPWWEWSPGDRGELIVTRPGDVMPLVRYPTGDIIEVVDMGGSIDVCGEVIDTAMPRIRVLSRAVDVVDFELDDEMGSFLGNKIYSRHIKDALQSHPGVRWWEMHKVQGKPGRLVFVVIPSDGKDRRRMAEEVESMLLTEVEDYLHTFAVAHELGLMDVLVTPSSAYDVIQAEMDAKARAGGSLGQLKPKHVHVLKDEDAFRTTVIERLVDHS